MRKARRSVPGFFAGSGLGVTEDPRTVHSDRPIVRPLAANPDTDPSRRGEPKHPFPPTRHRGGDLLYDMASSCVRPAGHQSRGAVQGSGEGQGPVAEMNLTSAAEGRVIDADAPPDKWSIWMQSLRFRLARRRTRTTGSPGVCSARSCPSCGGSGDCAETCLGGSRTCRLPPMAVASISIGDGRTRGHRTPGTPIERQGVGLPPSTFSPPACTGPQRRGPGGPGG